jgi:ABC-2 type transport system permease protein
VLLISGVYYSVDTLPSWLQVVSHLSPATYLLRAARDTIINGATVGDVAGDLVIMIVFAIVLIPGSIAVFSAAERWAKRNGRLKRQG